MKKTPATFEAYNELYELSLVRPHRTVTFRGFDSDELRATDAAMIVPGVDGATNGNGATPPQLPPLPARPDSAVKS
jgi:hypothetical protein